MGSNQNVTAEAIGSVPRCQSCGSERVVRDAWACFNRDSGLWELENVYDDAHCHQCEGKTSLLWSQPDQPPSIRVRELNDLFRTAGQGVGTVVITSGVQAVGDPFI